MPKFNLRNLKVGVVGLGYVGLPLAVEFGKHFPTVGFDIKADRIAELARAMDSTLEVDGEELAEAAKLCVHDQPRRRCGPCKVFIVTVPTPIDEYKRPDLTPLVKASETVGKVLKKGDVVVYESTVYPGCTEEVCVPILERRVGAEVQQGFLRAATARSASIRATRSIASADDQEGHLGLDAGGRRFVDALYRSDRHGRHAQGLEHQGGRGRQGDREHAARRQHRADQRAGADLQPARHRHRGRAAGRRHASGTSCRSGPAWSAATASAWTRTT